MSSIKIIYTNETSDCEVIQTSRKRIQIAFFSMFIILRFFVTDGFKTYREGLKNISGNITLSSPGVNIKINK